MRNNFSQISLFDIYSDISDAIEERDLSFFDLCRLPRIDGQKKV